MKSKIIFVGNQRAVILPQHIAQKLGGNKVNLVETADGILVRPATESSFQESVNKLRRNKNSIYKRMAEQASDADTIRYYSNPAYVIGDIF